MKRGFVLSILFLAVAVFFSNTISADNFSIGSTLDDFKLPDTNGKTVAFKDLEGKKGTIIVFISAQCPVVKAYNARISQLAADYKDKGINVVGINSNSTESLDFVKAHATENYKFPILIDKGNVIADKLTASTTPEMFLFDADNKLVYHGAIDNDRSGENITNNYLRTALDEFLAGKTITKTETKSFGCTIKRKGN
jgi:peroxiredoxin